MAEVFTQAEWKAIRETLAADPQRFGIPARQYGSFVTASFNIRKLGRTDNRSEDTWRFLAYVCRHFDLLAVQEVLDNLDGLRKLKELMGEEFGMIVSDKTGVFPTDPGVGERLAFLFNWRIVQRTEIATDITYDRSKLLTTIARNNNPIHDAIFSFLSFW